MRRLCVLFVFIVLKPLVVEANEPESFEDHAKIQGAVTRFIESNLRHKYSKFRIDLMEMDQRLRLQQCASVLEMFFPPAHREIGAVTVGVRCREPKSWLIYTRASVRAFGPVVVTKRALRRGSLITAEDIDLKEMDLSRIHHQIFHDPKDVVGKEIRRSLAGGSILTAQKLSVPKAVKRGDQVIILAKNKGMQIRMQGAALSDGIIGQRISVRNTSSNRVVEGRVDAPGIVEIQF